MTGKVQIVVNTATDDNDPKNSLLSLREAINRANKVYEHSTKYINFNLNESESKSSQKTSSKLNWNIKPSTPLPALTARNVFINYTNPKNVTINGEKLSKSKGRNYSLMTIGNYTNIGSTSTNKPSVKIKNINLVNNKVSGENGSDGGGGGLAAGAGLSVLHGDVSLNNVVFQDLTATGGNGSKSLGGAQSTYKLYYEHCEVCTDGLDPSRGNDGGSGGRPTLLGAEHNKHIKVQNYQDQPLTNDWAGMGRFFWQILGQLENWIGTSNGGRGGAPGTTKRHNGSGARGGDGLDGKFGVGGGGGGGGGGGEFIGGQSCTLGLEWFGCKKTPRKYGEGGDGGNGGKGGFGAGGGAGGTAGENAMGKGHRQPGGAGGAGGSVHGDNSGSRGADNVNIDGEKVAEGGSASGAGDALGAALAILNPNSKAVLDNVDFVNNKAISNNGSFDNIYMIPGSPNGALSGSSLYMYDDYNGTNRGNSTQQNTE